MRTLVFVRGIENFEYALGARNAHYNGVELLGYLLYGLVERADEG